MRTRLKIPQFFCLKLQSSTTNKVRNCQKYETSKEVLELLVSLKMFHWNFCNKSSKIRTIVTSTKVYQVSLFSNHHIVEKTSVKMKQKIGFEKLTFFKLQDIHWWVTATTVATRSA